MRFRVFWLSFALLAAFASPAHPLAAAEPPVISPTSALSPADERKAFTVPAGFDVQLVASEPDIQKPIQMAFDARGRLWVTTSHHYPFAAPAGQATDKLFILSDFDPATGKAKKVEVFANDLNIPIGILPLPDCKSCIVSSAGEIRKYTDVDGDGKADKMEVLFTGFGTRDTHGMYNSYTLMPDGWVYACHGYLNTSKVKGKDGHEVEMNSGNTFRFRPDGSRIEVYTRGQVNPFGIAVDPWFNLYTADCHSKPITQLIPGAYYDSFGKPHDGLGYAPHVTHHDHGSTALCGLTWYDADHFPKEYKGTMFLGNVVTSRINFDRIDWKGSSPVGVEQPDFLVSKDPWFRPTDIKLGPDGALYVADFYNKIIGHYEVDLKHPQRDKDRGRVWRITWKGKDGAASTPKMAFTDLTRATEPELVKFLENPNISVRLAAMHQLATRGEKGIKAIPGVNLSGAAGGEPLTRAQVPLMMLAERAGDVKESDWSLIMFGLKGRPEQPGDEEFIVGLARGLATRKEWGEGARAAANTLMGWKSPKVQRAAVDAVIFHPHAAFVQPLIEVLKNCPAEDNHLRQAARIALRNCLRDDEKAWPPFRDVIKLRAGFDPIYAEIAVAIPSKTAADYLLSQLLVEGTIPRDRVSVVAEHVARYGDNDAGEHLVITLTQPTSGLRADPLLATFRGLAARGGRLSESVKNRILTATEDELAWGANVPDPPPVGIAPGLLGASRVLVALPTVVNPGTRMELTPRSIEILSRLVTRPKTPIELRIAAEDALLRLAPAAGLTAGHVLLADPKTPVDVRDRTWLTFATSGNKEARLDARDSLKDVPYRTAIAIGTALAGTPAGAEDLLDAVKQGKAPARLLQEKLILERLRAANLPNLDKQIGELTKGLPPLDQRLNELIKQRAAKFSRAKTDKELGAKLFTKHCGACHRIGDQGGKIAPQLDGIGIRGLERLLEDTLDPNRNVDQAFRARVITTKDDRTITGLMLRVEGEVLIVADGEGKEIRIPTKEIDKNRETMLSPMPANFGDVIPEADFYNVIAYLLDQKAKDPPKK